MGGVRKSHSPIFCTYMEKSHREFLIHRFEYDKMNEDTRRLVDQYTTKLRDTWIWVKMVDETMKVYERNY